MHKLILFIMLLVFATAAKAAVLTGTVKGIVTDDITNTPIAGATVFAESLKVQTDENGHFEFDKIPAGKYTIIIDKQGYQVKTVPLSIEPNTVELLRIALIIKDLNLPEILIKADRATSAASSLLLNALDFRLRPMNSAQDMLRNVPGLFTAQHAGGGKAEQIFLRGFDADHGTDVAAFVDGMPVNMPSHGHGQGYLDLHFLIPETVKNLEVFKGTYFADLGDFATGGAVKFKTVDKLENNIVQLEGGAVPSQRTPSVGRALLMYQLPLKGEISSYVASEYIYAPSYFDVNQRFKRFNFFNKTIFNLNESSKLSLILSQFDSKWDASGQIPERAVEAGLISRFGSIDPTEGGNTARQNANITYAYFNKNQSFEAQAYASHYDFNLYSNFTFYLKDSVNGDGIRQQDDRFITGFNTKYIYSTNKNKLTLGAGLRYDDIENNLGKQVKRTYLGDISKAEIAETNTFFYLKNEFSFSPKLRAELGLRANYFAFNVRDLIPSSSEYTNYSGRNAQTQIAPKLNVTYSLSNTCKLFLNVGRGFHSNDAHAVIQDPTARKLPDAWGSEIGIQLHPLSNVVVSAALWNLELENELVFVGDEGTTENNGSSRRYGLDLSMRAGLTQHLFFDADINLSRGRFTEKILGKVLSVDNIIPRAPTITSTGGLTLRLPNGLEGAFRYRVIGDRAANEANTVRAKGYFLTDVNCFYKKEKYRVGISIENLFNVQWNEAQFDTESRLRNEANPVSELHFTPGTPFAAKLIFNLYF